MTITEQDLRELLDQDSRDGHCRGVTVADVDRRVKGMRRRRVQVMGSVAALCVAAVAVGSMGSFSAAPSAGPATGASLQPSPVRSEVSWIAVADPDLPLAGYREGGTRKTLSFTAKGFAEGGRVSLAITCPAGSYALMWFNGRLVFNARCVGPFAPMKFARAEEVRKGKNEVVAAVIPEQEAGADETAAEWAEEALANARPYEAKWSVEVMRVVDAACLRAQIRPESGTFPPGCPTGR